MRSSSCSTCPIGDGRVSRLIAGLPERDQRRAAVLLETCPAIDIAMDGIQGADGMAEGALLVVESGFLLVRSLRPGARRTVVALAGAGAILLPPDSHEELQALGAIDVLQPDSADVVEAYVLREIALDERRRRC